MIRAQPRLTALIHLTVGLLEMTRVKRRVEQRLSHAIAFEPLFQSGKPCRLGRQLECPCLVRLRSARDQLRETDGVQQTPRDPRRKRLSQPGEYWQPRP